MPSNKRARRRGLFPAGRATDGGCNFRTPHSKTAEAISARSLGGVERPAVGYEAGEVEGVDAADPMEVVSRWSVYLIWDLSILATP